MTTRPRRQLKELDGAKSTSTSTHFEQSQVLYYKKLKELTRLSQDAMGWAKCDQIWWFLYRFDYSSHIVPYFLSAVGSVIFAVIGDFHLTTMVPHLGD